MIETRRGTRKVIDDIEESDAVYISSRSRSAFLAP